MAEVFTQGVGAMLDAAADLNGAIGQGFAMDYEGATKLATFVNGMRTAARNARRLGDRMSQVPMLGSTPAAHVYKPYLPTVATDQDQGFLASMQKLQDQLEQAASSIQKSIAAYEQADAGVCDNLVTIEQHEMA